MQERDCLERAAPPHPPYMFSVQVTRQLWLLCQNALQYVLRFLNVHVAASIPAGRLEALQATSYLQGLDL